MSAHPVAEKWREDADILTRRGASPVAEIWRLAADELDRWQEAQGDELLTIAEAALVGGYSEEQLRRKVRSGELQAVRSSPKGRIKLRRSEIPRRPGGQRGAGYGHSLSHAYDVEEDARDIAERTGGSHAFR